MELVKAIFILVGQLIAAVWLFRIAAQGASRMVHPYSHVVANWQTISLTFLSTAYLTVMATRSFPQMLVIVPMTIAGIALTFERATLPVLGDAVGFDFRQIIPILLGLFNIGAVLYIYIYL